MSNLHKKDTKGQIELEEGLSSKLSEVCRRPGISKIFGILNHTEYRDWNGQNKKMGLFQSEELKIRNLWKCHIHRRDNSNNHKSKN